MENYRENLEIDLKDLAKYILKFWKTIILLAIIGLILGCALSGVKGYLAAVSVDEENEYADLDIELTDTQIAELDLALDTYDIFQKTRETVKDSILHDIESYNSTNSISKDDAEGLWYKIQTLSTTSNAQLSGGGSVYGSLNADQKKAFDKEIGRTEIEEEMSLTSHISMLKLGFLGAFGCAFLAIVFLALKYVLSPKLKTEDDIRSAFKLPVLGSIVKKTDDGLAVICSSIMALAHGKNAKNILLCSSLAEGGASSYMTQVEEFLKGKNIPVSIASNILSDPSSIDKAAESDGLILFEGIGESTYENISREVELTNNLGINVLGTVVVK
ncbi:hypothetical protein D6856_04600 [Butyrivibrio sp. XB500-5]|uniref:hypothetical protein n=1 Tax=Butyrivibrio sp. XB500-5 TaxID=2364880 RepID=UPI000EA8D446|nr:hypothetical protein [Butyrivibrio sp. XB500-5]RKM63407.1 hypothetical protein D6856_04600 [Butyrivibrio sp. XB500-5]